MVCNACSCNPDIAASVSADGPYSWWDILRIIKPVPFEHICLGAQPAVCLHKCFIDLFDDVTMGHAPEGRIVVVILGQHDIKLHVWMGLWVGGWAGGWHMMLGAC